MEGFLRWEVFKLARFQGDVHSGSDRAAATMLFVILLALLLLFMWYLSDPLGFNLFWDNVGNSLQGRNDAPGR